MLLRNSNSMLCAILQVHVHQREKRIRGHVAQVVPRGTRGMISLHNSRSIASLQVYDAIT